MTRTPIVYTVCGEHGEVTVDYNGNIIARCWIDGDNERHMLNDQSLQWLAMTPAEQDNAAYRHVYRFDVIEYRKWCREHHYDPAQCGNQLDIAEIGYWQGQNIYTPASEDIRHALVNDE